MKKLEAFTGKDFRVAEQIIKELAKNNYTEEDLFKFNKHIMATELKPVPATGGTIRRKGTVTKAKKKRRERKPEQVRLLAPGQTEITGLVCDKCGEKVITEGLCGVQVKKFSCVRVGTCIGCNKEFKIR